MDKDKDTDLTLTPVESGRPKPSERKPIRSLMNATRRLIPLVVDPDYTPTEKRHVSKSIDLLVSVSRSMKESD